MACAKARLGGPAMHGGHKKSACCMPSPGQGVGSVPHRIAVGCAQGVAELLPPSYSYYSPSSILQVVLFWTILPAKAATRTGPVLRYRPRRLLRLLPCVPGSRRSRHMIYISTSPDLMSRSHGCNTCMDSTPLLFPCTSVVGWLLESTRRAQIHPNATHWQSLTHVLPFRR